MKFISNKTLFNIHGWLGLNLGLFLFVVCFSGTFATISSEIDWLLNEDLRIEQKDEPIRWEAMYQDLRTTYPEGTVLGIYKNTYSGHGGHFAPVAYVGLPNGQNRKVYLDPYEGTIQGDTGFFNVQRFFRTYHRRLFDGERGIFLVTFSSFFLLFSALTGFLFYKGWLKNLFKLRIKRGVKMLFSDAHKFAGIWSLIFTLLIALTGIFYFVEVMLQGTGNYGEMRPEGPEPIERVERAEFGATPELLSLDEYVANAEEAFPELEILGVRVPHQTSDYVYVDGQAGNPITRNRANKVYLHPFTGEVVHIQRSSELNAAEFITDIADPLHFGYFGGLSTKILWFIFGLMLSFAILSGTYLWYIRGLEKMERRLKRKRSGEKDRIKGENKRLTPAGIFWPVLTSSRGAVLSTIIILYYFVATGITTVTEGIRSYGPLPEERITNIQEVRLGPWSADLKCEYPCTFEDNAYFLQFHGAGIPNYESLALEITTASNEMVTLPFNGSARNPSLTGSMEMESSAIEEIRLVASDYEDKRFVAPIAIEHFRKAKRLLSSRFNHYPERTYPEVPADVYLFILFFAVCTIAVLVAWTWFLAKTTSKKITLENPS